MKPEKIFRSLSELDVPVLDFYVVLSATFYWIGFIVLIMYN